MPTRRTNVKGKTRTRKNTVVPFKVPVPLLSRYIYVEARGWFSAPSATGNRAEGTLEDPISFADRLVHAKDVGHAYMLGAAAMDTLRVEDPNHGANHFTGQFLNDYVVKL